MAATAAPRPSLLWRVLLAGVRPDDSATTRRKMLQVNAGALLTVLAIVVYNLAFWWSGNAALISSGLWQLPAAALAPLTWWLNARRQLSWARWFVLLLAMVDVLLGMGGGQGSSTHIHAYYLLFAILVPTILSAEERWGMALLVAANLGAYALIARFGWPAHPDMALLPAAWHEGLMLSMLMSCVLIAVAMTLLTEAAVAENEARLQTLAGTDGLTGLANRRLFLQALTHESERARREGRQLSVAIVDVDHFKRINDHHGHDIGDQALVHLASHLRSLVRPYDVLARIGGEEFALLLPDTQLREAVSVTERFRGTLAGTALLIDGRPRTLTVSVGVAQLGRHETVDDWLRRADQALYTAKHEGRNRVRVAV
ncbi:diguanylate cyclase [Ideonella sp. 4Y11]|uniref:diguanylate cyclase n=1 Tax=Ideonella aquatica TaxID=2824119 RepID=A0A940YNR6_9BURK|nr:diguanylate cyclase [Ideonella aquatica]MBQ0959303.1 diguanylate cyclase [Ideonella aquatica]